MIHYPRLVFFLALLFSLPLTAQVDYGRVTYTRSVTARDQENPFAENEAIPGSIEQKLATMHASGAFDQSYTLTFAPGKSLYVEEAAEDITLKQGGGRMVTIMRSGKVPERYYTDRRAGTFVNSQNIADRQFLVSGKLPELEWTVTDRRLPPSESTGGFDLQIAEAITPDADTLLAGFARAIPLGFGPENYGGLPGAILQLTIYREKNIVHYGISDLALLDEKPEIFVPTEGKGVSAEEYARLEEKFATRTR